VKEALCKLLGIPLESTETEIHAAIAAFENRPEHLISKLEIELRTAAKVAAQSGMYESGAALRNKAEGVQMALRILTTGGGQ
jgi:hypothetical protein